MPYTNVTIRKKLGELGFIEDTTAIVRLSTRVIESTWKRTGKQILRLHESNNEPPTLYMYGSLSNSWVVVDIDLIPVLNVNLQNPDTRENQNARETPREREDTN
jgi:hypothetical protein